FPVPHVESDELRRRPAGHVGCGRRGTADVTLYGAGHVRHARSEGGRGTHPRPQDHRRLALDEREHGPAHHQDAGAAEGFARSLAGHDPGGEREAAEVTPAGGQDGKSRRDGMELTSTAFFDMQRIPDRFAFGRIDPAKHVALSENLNPDLAWTGLPPGTRSL